MPSPATIKRDQQLRAQRRMWALEQLNLRAIPFETRNQGAHIIVHPPAPYTKPVDWWPGTELFIFRDGTLRGEGNEKFLALLDLIAAKAETSDHDQHPGCF